MISGFPMAYAPIAGQSMATTGGSVNWVIGESATNQFATGVSCNEFSTDANANEFALDLSSNSIDITV